jgi:hypothetical protein
MQGIEVKASSSGKVSKTSLLKGILSSPIFLILFILASIGYYFLIKYIITLSNQGLALVTVPVVMLYLVSVSAGLLLTISIYSVNLSLKYSVRGVSEGGASVITTFLGSLVSSCGCSAPILGEILYALGANAIGVSGALSFVSSNQYLLLGIIVLINLGLIYYSLSRLSQECKITKNGRISTRK